MLLLLSFVFAKGMPFDELESTDVTGEEQDLNVRNVVRKVERLLVRAWRRVHNGIKKLRSNVRVIKRDVKIIRRILGRRRGRWGDYEETSASGSGQSE
ncbi:hypothetical protein ABFA07_012921 [Porites harrisoni]